MGAFHFSVLCLLTSSLLHPPAADVKMNLSMLKEVWIPKRVSQRGRSEETGCILYGSQTIRTTEKVRLSKYMFVRLTKNGYTQLFWCQDPWSVDPEFRVLSVLYSFWIFKVVYVNSVFVISWSYKLFWSLVLVPYCFVILSINDFRFISSL